MKSINTKIYNEQQEAAAKKVLVGVMFSPLVIVFSIATTLSIVS